MKQAGKAQENQPNMVNTLGSAGNYSYLTSEKLRKGSSYKHSEREAVAVGSAVGQVLRPLVDKCS